MARRKPSAIPGGGGQGLYSKFSKAAAKRRSDNQAHSLDVEGLPVALQGTSLFDPTLCELCLRWFCPPGGLVWSPFMGESSIGIVSSRLGMRYVGMDVRAAQAEANRAQSDLMCKGFPPPQWLVGDSTFANPEKLCGGKVDFVFACPPYADLEVYSEDPRDLSTMEYPAFMEAYRKIVASSCAALENDRFACFVVGEVRAPNGNYYGFVPDTIRAFADAGMGYYNEAILITAAASLPMRVARSFESTRKLGKTHQNVLIFLKGDAKRAVEAIGSAEFNADALAAAGATEQ